MFFALESFRENPKQNTTLYTVLYPYLEREKRHHHRLPQTVVVTFHRDARAEARVREGLASASGRLPAVPPVRRRARVYCVFYRGRVSCVKPYRTTAEPRATVVAAAPGTAPGAPAAPPAPAARARARRPHLRSRAHTVPGRGDSRGVTIAYAFHSIQYLSYTHRNTHRISRRQPA